jgi:hypothetical protein
MFSMLPGAAQSLIGWIIAGRMAMPSLERWHPKCFGTRIVGAPAGDLNIRILPFDIGTGGLASRSRFYGTSGFASWSGIGFYRMPFDIGTGGCTSRSRIGLFSQWASAVMNPLPEPSPAASLQVHANLPPSLVPCLRALSIALTIYVMALAYALVARTI